MPMNDLYQEIILDHARTPHHAGLREPFDAETHQVNPTCGDEVTLRLAVTRAADGTLTVHDVSYDAVGCAISQASISIMTDLVIGQSLQRSQTLEEVFESMVKSKGQDPGDEDVLQDAVAFAGVSKYANRVKCALLGWKAFKLAAAQAVANQLQIGENENHE
ncbi:MAG: Fe-S cluster assembly sulfur transfer protein SufU [Nakamurella sp.]